MEVTNWTLLKFIKFQLEGAKGTWLEELLSVLWAYWTTARTLTGEMSFNLTYGTKAIIPVEVGVQHKEIFFQQGHQQRLAKDEPRLPWWNKRRSIQGSGEIPTKDGWVLWSKSKTQEIQHKGPCLTVSYTHNKRSNPWKVGANLGRSPQSHPLLKTRKLPLGIHGW